MKSVLGLLAIICGVSYGTCLLLFQLRRILLAFPRRRRRRESIPQEPEGDSNISVYHVTNLNKSGAGSFADAVSQSGRIIVLMSSGTIEISGTREN